MTRGPEDQKTSSPDARFPPTGPSVAAYLVLIGTGVVLLAIAGVAAMTLDGTSEPVVVVEPPPQFVMDAALAAIYDEPPSLDDPNFEPGLHFCDRALGVLATVDSEAGTTRSLILLGATLELQRYRGVVAEWADRRRELAEAGDVDCGTADAVEELTERINLVYDVRAAAHAVHESTVRLGYDYGQQLITSGVEIDVAESEADRFAVAARLEQHEALRVAELEMLDRVEAVLEFCRRYWDDWRHGGTPTVVFFSERRADEHDALLAGVEAAQGRRRGVIEGMFGNGDTDIRATAPTPPGP